VGVRGALVLSFLLAALLAAWQLDLGLGDLIPGPGGLAIAKEFFAAAFTPALDYESKEPLTGAPPLLWKALVGAWNTLVFATAAMSLSVVFGLLLGFFAATSWWAGDPTGAQSRWKRFLRRAVMPTVYGITRVVIAVLRSIHELMWATIFLAGFGLNEMTGVIAITLPFSGTLAKVFSEMVDEAPRDAAHAMRSAGASPLQVFFFGLVPRALPDMSAYAFYRYECALRSSAILGFFGLQTLGSYIKTSFDEVYYGEVWTYIYVLFLLIVLFDWWSGALRRRFVA
jgi:phosphonate transport system permease protein